MKALTEHKSNAFISSPGRALRRPGECFQRGMAAVLLTMLPVSGVGQAEVGPRAVPPSQPQSAISVSAKANGAKGPTSGERRKAAKLYLEANKQFEAGEFESALRGYQQAAMQNPEQPSYGQAVEVARGHRATALVQQAARARIRGDEAGSRALLAQARELDPANAMVTQHVVQLADARLAQERAPLYAQRGGEIGEAVRLEPLSGRQDFHLRTNQQQVIQQVFKAYGLSVAMDASVRTAQVRFEIEGAGFEQAMRALRLATGCFYVPLDAHRVIVAADTIENRQKFERQLLETIYLPGLGSTDLTEVANLARNVFEIPVAVASPSGGTLTLRGSQSNLDALNATLVSLLDGKSQVVLDVKLIQLARVRGRTTGVQLPQTMSVFNVYAEARSLLTANQTLVDEIVASGLAASGDYLAIIAILLASGEVTSSTLSSGFATFGGGAVSTFGLAPGTTTLNFNLNSSESRALDHVQLRLGDNEQGKLRSGMRYPITTSSYSNLSAVSSAIAGLTSAGTSSALSSLASSLSALTKIPMMQYQDLGLTLQATPKVLRNGDVALTVDMKIASLTGAKMNDIPVLSNRNYSGVVTLRDGESQVIVSDLEVQESRAISGMPGLSEIPGMNEATSKAKNRNEASLLMVLTPHVVRGEQLAGHTPMLRIERNVAVPQSAAPSPEPAAHAAPAGQAAPANAPGGAPLQVPGNTSGGNLPQGTGSPQNPQ